MRKVRIKRFRVLASGKACFSACSDHDLSMMDGVRFWAEMVRPGGPKDMFSLLNLRFGLNC